MMPFGKLIRSSRQLCWRSKKRFSGVWAEAALKAPDAANARLEDAGRQSEDIRLQTLNRNCGEVPKK
jgi:hypothetical protein